MTRRAPAGAAPRRVPALHRLPALATATLAAGVLAAAALTGCTAAPAPHAPQVSPSHAAAPATGHTATAKAKAAVASCDQYASSLAPLPGPPRVTGAWMEHIRQRGYLIAGVDQNTYHFGFLNPLDGQFEGFDIDMVKAVAQAIFGSPGHIVYRALSDGQREPAIQSGSVDIVAHTMTILCNRVRHEDFSSVYFVAHQRVLVLKDSAVTGLGQLGGQKVCATTQSDSGGNLIAKYKAAFPGSKPPVLDLVTYWTDCLVLLQQRQVAAVSTDDAILEGLQAQDPFTKLVGGNLTDEPYGLAINKDHPEFVRFVNAVLAQMYKDGAWEKSYNQWVSPAHVNHPLTQYAD